jgi:Flp pilus assembly protein TadG
MKTKYCRRCGVRRGATLVEGAIVLTVTFLLIFGGLDLGIAVTRYNALCEAARRAARCTVVHGSSATQLGSLGPTAMEFTAAADNDIADSFRYVLATMKPAEVNALVEWPDGGNQLGDRVRVTLEYDHHPVIPIFLGIGNLHLKATSTMSVGH